MALHLAGWYQSFDPGGSGQINAMPDERLFTEGKNIRVNKLTMIAGAAGLQTTAADTGGSLWLYSPTLNIMGDSYIDPVSAGTTTVAPATGIQRWKDYMDSPLELAYDELVRAYTDAAPAAAGPQAAFVLFTDGNHMNIPSGRRITWRGAFSAPAAAGQWAPAVTTWSSELPPGDYGVIGMTATAATTMAARINTRQGEQWRPGVMVQNGNSNVPADFQKAGRMGIWATFPYTQLPTLEVCAVTAAAGNVNLDIVQLNTRTAGLGV